MTITLPTTFITGSPALDPVSNPDEFDYAYLAGVVTPGPVSFEGANSPRKWDKQAGYGTDGSSSKFTGNDLSEFTMKIRMWEVAHFVAWGSFKDLVKKTPAGVIPKAMDLRHPITADLGITKVVVTDVGQLTQTDDTGLFEIAIKFMQYGKPKPILGLPGGPIDKPNPQDDANDKLQQQVADKSAQLDALQKQLTNTP